MPQNRKTLSVRTFGDKLDQWNDPPRRVTGTCSFCKQRRPDCIRYSTRHYACDDCAEARRDVVLPSVKKRERFERRLAELRDCKRQP